MPVANDITNLDLRDALTANGVTGVTIDPTAYPDGQTATKVVRQLLRAIEVAQIAQNDFAGPGEDVQLLDFPIVQGDLEPYEYPAGSGTIYQTRNEVYTTRLRIVEDVTTYLPNLV